MDLNGTLDEDKCVDSRVKVNILDSTSVLFRSTMMQVPNLALTDTKWITVYRIKQPHGTQTRGPYIFSPWKEIIGHVIPT